MRDLNFYKEKLADFWEQKKRMPSYSELAKIIGAKSKTSAVRLVEKLLSEGFIEKDKKGQLLPGRLLGSLRVLGLVEAGFPSPAEEELADTMSLDEYLVPNKNASFILKVKGDSMKDAGIVEGDMVIVERTAMPKDGQIVVAEVDGAWTVKYYRVRGGRVFLEPANEAYKPIVPKNALRVAAVVRAVVRKY